MRTPIYTGFLQSDLDFAGYSPVNLPGWPPSGGGGGSGLPPGTINVKDAPYNAVGDGVTDDTTAIQAAITAVVALNGGTIFFPPGVYLVGGALQDTGRSNCQLRIPPVSQTSNQIITISFVGAVRPPTQYDYTSGTVIVPTGGYSTIKSTLTGGTGTAALLAGSGTNPANVPYVNNVSVNIYNMVFQMPSNPTLSCLNFTDMTGNELQNVLIHCGNLNLSTVVQPTNTNAYGVILPPFNHTAYTRVQHLAVFGYYTGCKLGELTDATGIRFWGCSIGLEIPLVGFPSVIRSVGIYWCPTGIKCTGTHFFKIDEMDVEMTGGGFGQAWQTTVNHVDDGSNNGNGAIQYKLVVAGGTTGTFVMNGGANISAWPLGPDIRGNTVYVGSDARFAAISGGTKLETRNTGTGVWVESARWTNP